MASYVLTLPSSHMSRTLENGVDMMVVVAASAAEARNLASSKMGQDNNAAWQAATVTEIVGATNVLGYTWVVTQHDEAGDLVWRRELTATGASQDTIDELGTALATLVGGTYNSTSQVVTVAASGSGDHTLTVEAFAPTDTAQEFPLASLVGAIVDDGDAGDALSFALPADAVVVPQVFAVGTSRA